MSDPEVLYHYCSTDTFISIVQHRCFWASGLSLSNDSAEGRLLGETVLRLARRDQMETQNISSLRESLDLIERYFDGLGFCLSAKRDLLSQWRGYADDGRGVAIGFAKLYLQSLSTQSRQKAGRFGFALHRVEYETDAHERHVEPTYIKLRELIQAGAFQRHTVLGLMSARRTEEEIAAEDARIREANRSLFMQLLNYLPSLYQLKSKAFEEEHEWRLVSTFVPSSDKDCEFRSRGDRVIPYRVFECTGVEGSPIVEVVLGPRHSTPIAIVENQLRRYGFDEVRVRRSSATYR